MPRLDVALRYADGRKEVVTVGRPADLIAFADEFDKIAPSGPKAIREVAWLTHRALKTDVPLEEWLEELDELTADDDAIASLRAELEGGVDPTPLVGADFAEVPAATPDARIESESLV